MPWRVAEQAVADYLRAHGFVVMHENLRFGALELDLVARRGDLVVIVEVRTRGPRSFDRPFSSIGRDKQRRLVRAAHFLWSRELSRLPDVRRVRIDVASVTRQGGRTTVEYVPGAITA